MLSDRINFGRYQRLVNRVLRRDCPIKVFDSQGHVIWGEEASGDAELSRYLARAPLDGSAVHRYVGHGGATVLYRALHVAPAPEPPAGWVTATTEHEAVTAADLDGLAEVFADAADGIEGEARASREIEKIAEELGERYEELHLMYAVDAHMSGRTGQNVEELRGLLQVVAEHMRADVAIFVQPAEKLCVHAEVLSKEIPNLDLVLVETRGDLFRFIQAGKETVVLNETEDPRRCFIFTDLPYRVLAAPVRSGAWIDSMVVLLNHLHKPPFTNSDRRLVEILANQLSSLTRSFLLLRKLTRFTEQLAEVMVEAVEAKDPYTRGHSERVNFLSMEIGRALGLPPDELQDLHWGSLLHDVGKIGIPDAILSKPSRLTKDEYTFIKVHPERSYEILSKVEHLQGALPGARFHQEMYDGNGYPHGLKGERIPLHARIIAVADTYDSITSSRAYRPGRSHEAALREIERVSGSQLDPAIVQVFMKLCADEPEWLVRFSIRREKAA
jgi:HD-GYP domain-containing protein (c-di-GMP phosphodiesterase class II)